MRIERSRSPAIVVAGLIVATLIVQIAIGANSSQAASNSSIFSSAQSDPLEGTWNLNIARSKFAAGRAAPKSQTVTYHGNETSKTATVETVDAGGNPTKFEFMHIYDGQPHATPGSRDFDALAFTRVDPNTIIFTRMKEGTLKGLGSLIVSPDGKTMTASGTGAADAGGNYSFLFEKR